MGASILVLTASADLKCGGMEGSDIPMLQTPVVAMCCVCSKWAVGGIDIFSAMNPGCSNTLCLLEVVSGEHWHPGAKNLCCSNLL